MIYVSSRRSGLINGLRSEDQHLGSTVEEDSSNDASMLLIIRRRPKEEEIGRSIRGGYLSEITTTQSEGQISRTK